MGGNGGGAHDLSRPSLFVCWASEARVSGPHVVFLRPKSPSLPKDHEAGLQADGPRTRQSRVQPENPQKPFREDALP